MSILQLLLKKEIISTRSFQSSFSKLKNNNNALEVVSDGKSAGVFFPKKVWNEFLEIIEDIEAQRSESYKKTIKKARKNIAKGAVVDGITLGKSLDLLE